MVDARGLLCPMPVVMVQNEVKKSAPQTLEVLVDNRVAVENIRRYAALQRYETDVREADGEYTLTLRRP